MKISIISLLTIHLFLLRKIKKIKMKEKLITDINVSSFLHWKVIRTQFVYVIIRVLFMPSAIQNPRNKLYYFGQALKLTTEKWGVSKQQNLDFLM